MVNNINNLRLLRWIIACTIVMMSVNFMINPAQANTPIYIASYITISNQSLITDYSGTTDKTIDWTTLTFYNASYTGAIYFEVENLNFTTFLTEGRSTDFTITSGGSGSGWAGYVASTHGVYWYFSDDTVLTESNITLSYDTNIFADISLLPSVNPPCSAFDIEENHENTYSYSGGDVNVTMPFSINGVMNTVKHHMRRDGGCNWAEKSTDYNGSANTYVKTDLTNNWAITHIQGDNYLVEIDKSVAVANSKITLEDIDTNFYLIPPSTFDRNDYEVIINISNGLVINMSNEGGTIEKNTVIWNASDVSSLFWEEDSYNIGDTATVNATFINLDHTNYFYNLVIVQPDSDNYYSYQIVSGLTGLEYDLTNIALGGVWTAKIIQIQKNDSTITVIDSDTMFVGTGFSENWIVINQSTSYINNILSISYGISDEDYDGGEVINIYSTNTGWFGDNLLVGSYSLGDKNGSVLTGFSEKGTYYLRLESFHYLTGTETLAEDMITITNYDPAGYSVVINPKIAGCDQYVNIQFSTNGDYPIDYYIIRDSNNSIIVNKSNVYGLVRWRANRTGYYQAELYDNGQMQISDSFEVFGTCNGYNVTIPGGDNGDGIKPKDYPQTDQATSNANLQNNLLYFMGLPIFWGMIIFCGILIVAATLKAGRTIPYIAPAIILFELVIGMLEPYSSYFAVAFGIFFVLYFIFRIMVRESVA